MNRREQPLPQRGFHRPAGRSGLFSVGRHLASRPVVQSSLPAPKLDPRYWQIPMESQRLTEGRVRLRNEHTTKSELAHIRHGLSMVNYYILSMGTRVMQSRSWIPILPLAVALALQSTAPSAQEVIGKATAVKPQAEGTHAGTLSNGSSVYSKETVRTGDSGRADLLFQDSSNLSVGPKSSVRLDKFVYDPNKSTGTIAVEATRGSFRFVTGSQNKGGSYSIKTPYGTLGVRG